MAFSYQLINYIVGAHKTTRFRSFYTKAGLPVNQVPWLCLCTKAELGIHQILLATLILMRAVVVCASIPT